MSEAEQSLSPSVLRRVFYGPSELRAGWRLLIFLAIVIALINVSNLMVRRVLHGADNTTFFFGPRSDGLPHLPPRQWHHGMYRRQDDCRLRLALAQDVSRPVLAGRSARLRVHHWLTGCHASRRSLLFWKHRTARPLHLEVGHRLRLRFHSCLSAGRVPRSLIRAIYALGRHRFLVGRNSLGSIFWLLSSWQLRRGLDRIV